METQTDAVRALLAILSERGRSIADCVPLIGRTAGTLKKYAREAGLQFSDYRPRKKRLDGTEV